MPHDPWLPLGIRIPPELVVGRVVASGADWQVIRSVEGGNALLVTQGLKDRWISTGILTDRDLVPYRFGDSQIHVIDGGMRAMLVPLDVSRAPNNLEEALRFAAAMEVSRALCGEASFSKGLYVERLSRILPTYVEGGGGDADVLGTWLTGGVPVSALSISRLSGMLTWLSEGCLADIVKAAGLGSSLPSSDAPASVGHAKASGSDGQRAIGDQPRFRLPGRPHLEDFFNDHVVDVVQNRERYRALGLDNPPGIILEGPPGCGKTVAVEKLVQHLGWPAYTVDAGAVASPYIHETSRKIHDLFQKAIQNAPSVLIIDEMDAFLSMREASASSTHRVEEISEFLRRIPEAIAAGVLLVAMTNRIDMVDPAILRRGRFDHVLRVDYADEAEVLALASDITSGLPLSEDVDLSHLARALAGRPLSDVSFAIREGARLAAKGRLAHIDAESLASGVATALSQPMGNGRQPMGFVRSGRS